MIKSMTGYGRGKNEINGREYIVEIKAVNHRYNDISIRMPRYLVFLEDKLRQYISKNISRGKIDIYITLNNLYNLNIKYEIRKKRRKKIKFKSNIKFGTKIDSII